MTERIERDSLGEIRVETDKKWGAQTQRSLQNFPIGEETMPREIILAFAHLKKACALVNGDLGELQKNEAAAIAEICDELLAGGYADQFPLKVWQTGSGTQTNMNLNEVIAHIAAERGVALHPNDHVNRSQSSNDTFPTAMNLAAVVAIQERVLPALETMRTQLKNLEKENAGLIKIGRTHLQDATPILFSQEIGGWRGMLEECAEMLKAALFSLSKLAIGGTAVGTGLNAPEGFDRLVCRRLSDQTGLKFTADPNKFHALTSRDAFVFAHGALKALAADLMKIANDIRLLASGPRCGLGEVILPANEPGSSIMPGKVNPTQCEALSMVAVQVIANDAAIGLAASQGHLELNVFLPVCAYNFLQSARLLADGMRSFTARCLCGLKPNAEKMEENLRRSLMLVTCLSPKIGYENAARIARQAHEAGVSLREAALQSGLLTAAEFDEWVNPQKMI